MYPNNKISFVSRGLNFLKGINYVDILDGTSKTLNVVNQAIPIIYQTKPLLENIATIFKISNAVKENEVPFIEEIEKKQDSSISPVFYL